MNCRRGYWLLLLGVVLASSCMHNRPNPPTVPVGPRLIEVDSTYTYKTSASNGKQYEEYGLVWVRFDWGDGDTSMWCGHGETVECSHSWRDGGVFAVRAQAHDQRTELSEWSAPCSVTAVVPPYPYRLVDSVLVADEELLAEVQVLPGGEFIYVTSEWDASLWVVRTSDLRLVDKIPFYATWWGGGNGERMACSPDGKYVYATDYRYDYLAKVPTADRVVSDSLMLGEEMTSIAVSLDGSQLFVAVDDDSGFIVVVRLPDFVVEDTVFMPGMGVYVTAMTVSPDGTRLYAANPGDDCVFSIRLSDHTVEWQVPAGVYEGPDALILHPAGTTLYTLEYHHVSVRLSATGSLVDSIALPPFWGADIAPDGSFLYVTGSDSAENGTLAVVRTSDNKVVRTISMPDAVDGVVASPDGKRLYMPADNGKLYVLGR